MPVPPAELAELLALRLDSSIEFVLPDRVALAGPGQSLLRTRLGRVDVLGNLHSGQDYAELLATADTVDFDGRPLRIIDLQTLIAVKSSTGRAKDRLVVPVLLELARRRASESG